MSIRRNLAKQSAAKRALSDADEERVRAMHKSGQPIRNLARIFNVSRATIQSALIARAKSPWIEQREREGR